MSSSQRQWELENDVKLVDPYRDALYALPSPEERKKLDDAHPWRKEPRYFTSVRISALALLKMVMHARSGGSIEVMGMMLGYVTENTFVVTDAFRLPVEGTETRVNAHEEAYEYMVKFPELARAVGQAENVVGWYHSHPGYGCWLSGIDVQTQSLQQSGNEPFLAIVVDPDRTVAAGKVEIGAFRAYPDGHKPAGEGPDDGFQSIPQGKMEDFGAHADRYYSLDVSVFKSTLDSGLLDALWEKYWVATLSASPLIANRAYGARRIEDLASKVTAVQAGILEHSRSGGVRGAVPRAGDPDEPLSRIVQATNKLVAEDKSGLMAAEVKETVFGRA